MSASTERADGQESLPLLSGLRAAIFSANGRDTSWANELMRGKVRQEEEILSLIRETGAKKCDNLQAGNHFLRKGMEELIEAT